MPIDVIALVKVSISYEKKNCKVDLTNSANFVYWAQVLT